MVTRRSLNKLERKAHMSIHNTVEVVEEEVSEVSNTRDRFGKKHKIVRGQFLKVELLVFAFVLFNFQALTPLCFAKGPNVQINSDDLGPISLNEKSEPKEEKPVLYADDSVVVGFNDDSEPNVGMRF